MISSMKFRPGVSGLSFFGAGALSAIAVSPGSDSERTWDCLASKRIDGALDDQNLFLFEVALQLFLELAEESPRGALVRRNDTEDDDLVAVRDFPHPPVTLVRLREECDAVELLEQPDPESGNEGGVDRRAVVVVQRQEDLIF